VFGNGMAEDLTYKSGCYATEDVQEIRGNQAENSLVLRNVMVVLILYSLPAKKCAMVRRTLRAVLLCFDRIITD
jgi:hypothetical protein